MAFTDIVLADAQATPVNHTFTPMGIDKNGVLWLVDRSNANAVGFWKISVELKQPGAVSAGTSSDGRSYRYRVGLHEPVLEQVGTSSGGGYIPAARVAYVSRSFHEYILPERGLDLDRKNLVKMSGLLITNPQVVNMIQNLTFPA